jgi:CheY-like chemotaxis protein
VGSITIRSCTVLLVDDDALISMATAEMLSDLGHRVLEAHSGTNALEILRGGIVVDLVITDQGMPGMTGTGLAAEIRALWPPSSDHHRHGHADLPKDGTLALPRVGKPYGEKDLAAAIASVARIGTA